MTRALLVAAAVLAALAISCGLYSAGAYGADPSPAPAGTLERKDARDLTRLHAISYWMQVAFVNYDFDEIEVKAAVRTCERKGRRTMECEFHALVVCQNWRLYCNETGPGKPLAEGHGVVHLERRRDGRVVSWMRPYVDGAKRRGLRR